MQVIACLALMIYEICLKVLSQILVGGKVVKFYLMKKVIDIKHLLNYGKCILR